MIAGTLHLHDVKMVTQTAWSPLMNKTESCKIIVKMTDRAGKNEGTFELALFREVPE